MKLSALDFLHPPAAPRIGWVLLGAGALALGAATVQQQQGARDRSAALQLQRELAALQLPARPKRPVELTLAQRRWRQAQRELARPWLPALGAIESATLDPVYLLSLTVEPGTGRVKLQAEAPSFDHALAYVQRLDSGGALQPAVLLSHADGLSARGDKPAVKFSVATHWNTR